MNKFTILMLASVVSGGVWADCDDLRGKEYAKCTKDLLTKSRNDLEQTFKEIYSRTPWYSQPSFSNAQKAWQKYRDTECEYQVSLNSTASDTPNDSPIEMAQCLTRLNQKRIIDLGDD